MNPTTSRFDVMTSDIFKANQDVFGSAFYHGADMHASVDDIFGSLDPVTALSEIVAGLDTAQLVELRDLLTENQCWVTVRFLTTVIVARKREDRHFAG
jgi:hypothetical protein